MGGLLRRYWMPIAGASEFDANPVRPVRLCGEDLVLYKDLGGRYGLVGRHCPHRRADMSYGYVEDEGIRCSYHGWTYAASGRCIAQPYEDTTNPSARSRHGCDILAYPVRELAGLLWAYLGPAPAPELPIYEPFTWENGFREIVLAEAPCNWLQCQENSIDPVHFEWMHDNWTTRLQGQRGPYAPRHLKLKFEEFDHGLIYKRVREGMDETSDYWTVGRVALWPIGFFLGMHFEWRVPIDDVNTLSIAWFFMRVPKGREPYVQDSIPAWMSPIRDAQGRLITSHVINQDIVGWVGQGTIADRTKENLRSSDVGVGMMRKRFFDDLAAVADGRDPSAIIRDPAAARRVRLPNMMTGYCVDGVALADHDKHPLLKARLQGFRHHYGQPEHIRRAFERAMGIGAH
ncbi:MAG: aromatic ring-hydroxylating dioxygenase subunit alpha [Proteobacteria bacterium]|nr:aromatic ring-hydroxylating dioxygenase subunit alpha [Pseudomonadota bacterium]